MRPTSAERPRTALVTGGAHGIGRAIADALAADGHEVVVADVDVAAASARAVRLDVTDVRMLREVIAAVDAETPLDTVVNNAGVAFRRPLVDVDPDEYDRLMAEC